MNKYKLILEYDGTNYSGWQAQKNAKSIQTTLIAAAEKFLEGPVDLQGAGRTDAGVHALGQVAHLACARQIACDRLRMGLNDLLPAGINILSVENAPAHFHARHSAIGRSYLYLIARRRTAFGKKYVWWVKDSINVSKLRQALELFRGFHDFKSFADKRMEKDASTKVAVDVVELVESGRLIAVRIAGSHFLWKMVRRIIGVAVEASLGRFTPAQLQNMLKTYSDIPARHTAPPSGLYLEKGLYDGDRLAAIRPPLFLS
jgi:tRNA pseudouridine38-40 synthase